jgi:Ca2+-binding EF-hand superfamily protein
MRIFWGYSWFQKECVKLMVQAFDGEQEIENMKCVYFYLDTDYSGSIEINELTNFYKENHGMKSAAYLDKIVAEMNEYYLKEPGVITFTELMAMGLGKEFFCDLHRLETIFRYFDLDGRGGVSAENIDRCFKRFGRNIGVARINEVIQSGDVDGDNLIQFDEFRDLMWKNKDGSVSGGS